MNTSLLLKWVEIRQSAVSANLRTVRRLLDTGVGLMAVVKADAYGHGAVHISRLASAEGADCLGVLTLDEALTLRSAGIRKRLILLSPPLPAQAQAVVRAGVEPTVDSIPLARALSRAARSVAPVHVDIDYGLGRWGVPPQGFAEFSARLRRMRGLRLAGVSAHLDYVPGRNAVEAEDKLRRFSRLASALKSEVPALTRHCANSSILLDFPHWQLDMVRIGNLLYGINPTSRELPLKNPWKLCARIISIKTVAKGSMIGYGSEYLAPRRMKVAALPIGYADGMTMEPAERLIGLGSSFRYWGMLRKKRVPFVGRTGISHVLVDVSAVPNAKPGDCVTLPVRRTSASPRLPRVYT